MEQELEVLFAKHQLRLTNPRKAVFTLLHDTDTPLSTAVIARKLKHVDRVSVYRTIDLFVKLGIIEIVHVGWKQQYELTSPFKSHHHHLSCTNCGKLIDLHSQKFEQIVAGVAKEYSFMPTDHTFEIRGLCADCRK